MAKKNVFVFGLNAFNRDMLTSIGGAEDIQFHKLLDLNELVERDRYPIEEILEHSRDRLRRFPGPVDGIIHYIDFPVSTMVPILAEEFGLPSAPLKAVLTCEHKYWSRIEQAGVIPDCVPPFAAFDPFDDEALSRLERDVGYPFWVKPIKSFSSYLGFRIGSAQDFHEAMAQMRAEIARFAEPFDYLLDQVGRPPAVADIGGGHCIAEGIIGGRQCTLEGYGYGGEIEVYGAIDSIRHANRSSFGRYQYPSTLPKRVKRRMIEATRRFMSHIGYDNAPFNVEWFWDRQNDRIWLLEVNTRISESHCDLFEKVDGTSSHEVAVDLALGQRPEFTLGAGEHRMAGKFLWRVYDDGVVTRAPSASEVAAVEQALPGTKIQILAREGARLSELMDQDSYTYCLALLFIGGDNQRDILDKYRQAQSMLPFEFNRIDVAA